MWASQNNVVYGYGNGNFGPNDPLTREQIMTIIYRYAMLKEQNDGVLPDLSKNDILSQYNDIHDISDWALPAMNWSVTTGLIQGRTASTIVPKGEATRAEVAAIFMRFIKDYVER
jgi:hypothetical protein